MFGKARRELHRMMVPAQPHAKLIRCNKPEKFDFDQLHTTSVTLGGIVPAGRAPNNFRPHAAIFAFSISFNASEQRAPKYVSHPSTDLCAPPLAASPSPPPQAGCGSGSGSDAQQTSPRQGQSFGKPGSGHAFAPAFFQILRTEDPKVIGWSSSGKTFRVGDSEKFAEEIMPKWFNKREYWVRAIHCADAGKDMYIMCSSLHVEWCVSLIFSVLLCCCGRDKRRRWDLARDVPCRRRAPACFFLGKMKTRWAMKGSTN